MTEDLPHEAPTEEGPDGTADPPAAPAVPSSRSPSRPVRRLMSRRTGAHRAGVHRASRSRRTLLPAAVVVLGVIGTVLVLLIRPGDDGAPADPAPWASGGSPAAVADDVAGWVDAELPADAVLSAPDDVRPGLVAAGIPEDRLVDGDADALHVVAGDPGADAVVVARFRGDDGMLLSVVDPRPGVPTAEELDRRQRLSAAVLANPVAGATGRAAEVLRTAEIDARLLGLVAVLVARLDAGIADVPRAPAQPDQGTPARRALVDSIGDQPLVPGSEAAERVRAFVAAQRPPFAPDTVEVTEDGVLVGFDYVSSPDAAVTEAIR